MMVVAVTVAVSFWGVNEGTTPEPKNRMMRMMACLPVVSSLEMLMMVP